MLQYALNDAKSVTYIFHLYIGLLKHLNLKTDNSSYYETICLKFTEYNQKSEEIIKNQIYYILDEACLATYETIKAKLRDNYMLLAVENIN
jgi:galactokinase/mevalonate kinase-like predicted kinase